MKEIIGDFIKLFTNCMLVLCLMLSSFLLIINMYHSKEVSYVYYNNLNDSASYNNAMKTKEQIAKNINNISTKDVVGVNVKSVLQQCYNDIDSSTFAKFKTKQSFVLKDSYDAAIELRTTLNTDCLFNVTYIMNGMKETGLLKKDITDITNYVSKQKDYILTNNNYLVNKMLANSTYSFVTDVTRSSVYNNTAEILNETLANYSVLIDTMEKLSSWCANEIGG